MSTTFVYAFDEGSEKMRDLLGGKGAGLAEMVGLGLPVPPGFTITTQACRAYLSSGDLPAGVDDQVTSAIGRLEQAARRRLGDPEDPLLLAVRSGAVRSMPGMMDTVLDIGLNDQTVLALAAHTGDERFAWDSYRRLLGMFGTTVLGIAQHDFDQALGASKRAKGSLSDLALEADDLSRLAATYKRIIEEATGEPFPQDPRTQLDAAIRAVFESWNGARARLYRRQEHIPDDLGTAVNVVCMVFGNLGENSGTGVAFTRDPASGQTGVYGDYLPDAQGEDVVAGIRNTVPLQQLESIDPASYAELRRVMSTLESHYRDLCDIEFTIERGKLWMLQTRVGKRTPAAAFRIAMQLVHEGVIDMDEALRRVDGAQLSHLMFPRFDTDSSAFTPIATGTNASPGAAVGSAYFTCAAAVEAHTRGERVMLVRPETTPDDLDGMLIAEGILTSRGGRTSHAAVVARGMGTCCVCGAEDVVVDVEGHSFTTPDGAVVREGDVISVDGTTGKVYLGEIPVVDSPVVEYLDGRRPESERDDVVAAVHELLAHADHWRRLHVRANADNGPDAARARRFGAEGVGLCRTEHMFLGERRVLVERLVLSESDEDRESVLVELGKLQRQDFEDILHQMAGLPVTVRLIDPPLHEFLPDLTELSVRVAVATERGTADPDDVRLLGAVRRLHEENPMLGLRGVRLGIVVPGVVRMQVRALAEAAVAVTHVEAPPTIEIMVPLVASVHELERVAVECRQVMAEVEEESGVTIDYTVGTMIELPRAALTAGEIAGVADFFSFGTNDLTQTTWGLSRDDAERSLIPRYLEVGIFPASPFEEIDVDGVGRLVRLAVEEGRRANPALHTGVCGEHGGNPASVHFFHGAGLDYVSCSPFRVPVARLEAGRAALLGGAAS